MKQTMDKKELKDCVGGATQIAYSLLALIEGVDPGSVSFFAAHPQLANALNNVPLNPPITL